MTPSGPSLGQMNAARAAAASIQQDTCTVVRRTKSPTLDQATGKYPIIEVRIYPPVIDEDDAEEPTEGPCRLKHTGERPREIDAQSQELAETALVLSLPIATSTGVQKDDIAIMRTSLYDPGYVDREFRIEGPFGQTQATARRFAVEETS